MPNYDFACDISCLYVFIGTLMCKNDPKTHLVSTDLSDAGVALLQPVGV